jgi:hypothetical protein
MVKPAMKHDRIWSMNDQQLYDELSCYTLSLRDPTFIHQYIVDAYAAQHAGEETKPITIAFALAGLYLHHEKGFSGKEVQRAHMKLAGNKKHLPLFELPGQRGEITVADVMCHAPGIDRDQAIERWTASVWNAWKDSHARVAEWLETELIVPR